MKLSKYRRSFNGFLAQGRKGCAEANLFLCPFSYTLYRDEIRGQGIFGYYYLNKAPIFQGSEQVFLEVRDKDHPDEILSQKKMQRDKDYEIDYDLGSLMFKEPIPYEDAQGNPVYIVVDYYIEGGAKNNWTIGGSIKGQIADKIKIQTNLIKEEIANTEFLMLGGMTTLSLAHQANVLLEAAKTKSTSKIENTHQEGLAWQTSLTQKITNKTNLKGYYQDVGKGFGNPQAKELYAGTYKYGLTVNTKFSSNLSLNLDHFRQKEKRSDKDYRQSTLSLRHKGKTISAEFSLISEHSEAGYKPSNTVSESIFSKYNLSELTLAQFKMKTKMDKKYSLFTQYQQALNKPDFSSIDIGVDYQVSDVTKSYLKLKRSFFPDKWESKVTAGWKSKLIQGVSLYQEYEIEDGINGQDSQHKIGLNSKFTLEPGCKGNLAIEQVETQDKDGSSGDDDFLAVALGFEHLDADNHKWTHRYEIRKSPSCNTFMGEMGVISQLSRNYTLLSKVQYFQSDKKNAGQTETWNASLNLAYRPVYFNRFNLLSKLEYKSTQDTISLPNLNSYTYLSSVHAVYSLTKKLKLRGRYAGKFIEKKEESLNKTSNLLQLSSISLIYDVTDRWDFGLGYQIMWDNEPSQHWQGYFGEIGYKLSNDLWLTTGYSFNEFIDEELTERDYSGQGPYIKLKFKFDESYLKFNR